MTTFLRSITIRLQWCLEVKIALGVLSATLLVICIVLLVSEALKRKKKIRLSVQQETPCPPPEKDGCTL